MNTINSCSINFFTYAYYIQIIEDLKQGDFSFWRFVDAKQDSRRVYLRHDIDCNSGLCN